MDIEEPLKCLGEIDVSALTEDILGQDEEAWHEQEYRQRNLVFVLPQKGRIIVVSRALIHVAEPVIEAVVVGVPGIVDLARLIDISKRPFADATGRVTCFLQAASHG